MTAGSGYEHMKLFLSVPFTAMIDSDSGLIMRAHREYVLQILGTIRNLGHDCFCSMEREEWGAKLYTPEDAYRDDRQRVLECDGVVAILGNPISPGVIMELTMAAEHKKPALVYQLSGALVPYLLPGFSSRTQIHIQIVSSPSQVVEMIPSNLAQLWSSYTRR